MTGRHEHNIDAKGRLAIPAKMRESFGETFIAAAVMDNCISLYTMEDWDAMLARMEELPMTKSRQLLRYLCSNAVEVTQDAQGRILLPKHLLDYAELQKEALIIGAGGHRAEIWNPAKYDRTVGEMTEADVHDAFMSCGF